MPGPVAEEAVLGDTGESVEAGGVLLDIIFDGGDGGDGGVAAIFRSGAVGDRMEGLPVPVVASVFEAAWRNKCGRHRHSWWCCCCYYCYRCFWRRG